MILLLIHLLVHLCHSEYERNGTHYSPDGFPLNNDLIWAESPEYLTRLFRNSSTYDKQKTPTFNKGVATDVQCAIYVESMSSFRATTMDFDVDMYLMLSWKDERLQHSFIDPVLITDVTVANRLWIPDIYFVNSKAATLQTVTTPNLMVLIYHDGFVMKSQRVSARLACQMDFSFYPMDTQSCPISVQSYAYVRNMLNLTWYESSSKGYPISYNPEIRFNDMALIENTYGYCNGVYPLIRQDKGIWSCLEGQIRMKRFLFYHFLHLYIPSSLLVIVSWLSFWLDARAAPARVGLTITTLLTLTTMSNGARMNLPQVNYIKAIDVWLFVCTGMIFSVLLEYTLIWFYIGRIHPNCKFHRDVNNKVKLKVELMADIKTIGSWV